MPLQLVKYRCPHCGHRFAVDDEEIGTEIRCPNSDCRQPIQVEPEDVIDDASSERKLRNVHPAMVRAHPFVALGLGAALAAGIALLWRWAAGETMGGLAESAVLVAGLVLAAGSALGLFVWWVVTRCTSLKVTTERSLLRRGVLSRETSEVRHRDVRNMQVQQGLYQRLVGIGELSISSAGQEDMEIVVRGIPSPQGIAGMIRDHQ